jgi:hypothetical protein
LESVALCAKAAFALASTHISTTLGVAARALHLNLSISPILAATSNH